MKEFVEKLIGRLEEQAEQYRRRGFEHEEKGYSAMADKYYGKQCSYLHSIEIVNQIAEEYKDKAIINEQYCWQTCGATEHCKECNRLCNGSIDYYENYDVLAEEHKDCSTDTSTDCENCLSTEYIQDKLQEQYRNGYADGWHDYASTIQQSTPYQPKGE